VARQHRPGLAQRRNELARGLAPGCAKKPVQLPNLRVFCELELVGRAEPKATTRRGVVRGLGAKGPRPGALRPLL
jgi:hypothetical protein